MYLSCVLAATDVTQGLMAPTDGAGPELPPAAETNMPALAAQVKADHTP
jgi:hypothetical protein